ncbi:uncharacterized protein PG986_005680 [Apiospora aurea]|uniref:Uncharacterized protein n=1 Tax=Apiospora aurea TaxID=335848 RepID=A0ABR1QIJ9_9PEZI
MFVVRNSKNADLATIEAARTRAITVEQTWVEAAMAAAEARVSFMTKYPGAFKTASHQKHIKAAVDNLNSARAGKREIQIQNKKITEARAIAQRKATTR